SEQVEGWGTSKDVRIGLLGEPLHEMRGGVGADGAGEETEHDGLPHGRSFSPQQAGAQVKPRWCRPGTIGVATPIRRIRTDHSACQATMVTPRPTPPPPPSGPRAAQ